MLTHIDYIDYIEDPPLNKERIQLFRNNSDDQSTPSFLVDYQRSNAHAEFNCFLG